MDTLKLCGVALVASFCTLLIRELKKEFEIPVKLCASVVLLGAAAGMASPLTAFLSEGIGAAALGNSFTLLIRALAIALAVKLSSDICRECGAQGVASALEITGKIEMILLSLPLINEAIEAVSSIAF